MRGSNILERLGPFAGCCLSIYQKSVQNMAFNKPIDSSSHPSGTEERGDSLFGKKEEMVREAH